MIITMKLPSQLLPIFLGSIIAASVHAHRGSFDMSKYSLKVHSCASVTGIDPDNFACLAEDDSRDDDCGEDYDEKWTNKTTAVINYRLCPSNQCQDSSWSGCYNSEGNYMVTAKEFLESKIKFRENKDEEFCDKCKWCSWMYSKFSYTCDIYSECQSSCPNGKSQTTSQELDYTDFTKCSAVDLQKQSSGYYKIRKNDKDASNLVYLQVYCDGGTSLKLGVFSDEDCIDNIESQYTMSKIKGLSAAESILDEDMASACVSCAESDDDYEIPEYDENGGTDYRKNRDAPETCQNINEDSLQCNEYIPSLSSSFSDYSDKTSCGLTFKAREKYDLGEYLFDMSQYSLKVHSCANLPGVNPDELEKLPENYGKKRSWRNRRNDDWSNKNTTVINYRLCPTDTCQGSDDWDGCSSEYGSYMVSAKEFLESKRKDDDSSDNEKDKGDQEEIEYHRFAECTAVDIYEAGRRKLGWWGNDDYSNTTYDDNKVYLQIYCDGGTTLKIGIYSDEDCSNYVGDQYDISTITSLNVTESDLEDELTSDCVSCHVKEGYYDDGDESEDERTNNDDDIADTCKQVYQESLKCNEHLPFNTTKYYKEADEWKETMDDKTCEFLEAIQSNDESNSDSDSGSTRGRTNNSSVSSNSYTMSYNTYTTSSQSSLTGGNLSYAAGVGALALVGIGFAAVSITGRNSRSIGKGMEDAFGYKGGADADDVA